MCGIAGLIGHGNRQTVAAMTSGMEHRGPDADGFHIDEVRQVFLGHRRLSIIDLPGGSQPMYNEDGSVGIVFNGEIYNHLALRAELESKGHVFKTRCDTESIIHAYEEYGERVAEKLVGMFAFAIWDNRRGRLLLVRDRLGIKPLYYCTRDGRISFASELGALMLGKHSQGRVSLQALSDYLTYKYIPDPATIYEDVFSLQPGHQLVWQDGGARIASYWNVSYGDELPLTEEDAGEQLMALLTEAVRCRLMSDVPLGAFLSGGVDSSVVVALMSKLSDNRVKTFTIGFEDKSYSELPHAALVARHLGTEHHEMVVRPDAVSLVDRLIEHFGQPFADSSAIPTYLLSQFTRKSVTVALSGDGGDEVFAGYETYRAWRAMQYYRHVPWFLRRGLVRPVVNRLPVSHRDVSFDLKAKRFIKGDGLTPTRRHLLWMTQLDDDVKRSVLGQKAAQLLEAARVLEEVPAQPEHELKRVQYLDTKVYLPGDILVKVDRMSMAHALEVRVPLLDHRVVEFAARLPVRYKLRNLTTKYILKKAAASWLPASIPKRPKKGFSVPMARWLREDLREMLLDTLSPGTIRSQGFFEPKCVARLVKEHQDKIFDRSRELWTLMVFTRWCAALRAVKETPA